VEETAMAGADLLNKLGMQPGQRVLMLNAPAGYLNELGELPEGVKVAEQHNGTFDFVQVFVKDLDELKRLAPLAADSVTYEGLFWVSYPNKGSKMESDLTRDVVWEEVAKTGLRAGSEVSLNDVWSAIRFRPPEKVGK
jgi:hypothetical protein